MLGWIDYTRGLPPCKRPMFDRCNVCIVGGGFRAALLLLFLLSFSMPLCSCRLVLEPPPSLSLSQPPLSPPAFGGGANAEPPQTPGARARRREGRVKGRLCARATGRPASLSLPENEKETKKWSQIVFYSVGLIGGKN